MITLNSYANDPQASELAMVAALKSEIEDLQIADETSPLKAAIDEIGYQGAAAAMLYLLHCEAEIEVDPDYDTHTVIKFGPFKMTVKKEDVVDGPLGNRLYPDVEYDEAQKWVGA